MSLLTRADVRSGCWRIWGSARTRASPDTPVRSGEQGQQEADAKARRSRRCGGKTTGRSRCSASARDDRDTCGCVACQQGCAFVAGGPLPLALPCRMGSILASAPPGAAAAASRRHQRLPDGRCSELGKTPSRRLQRQPPSFSRCAPCTSWQCQLRSSQRTRGARARSEGRRFVPTRRAQRFRQPPLGPAI